MTLTESTILDIILYGGLFSFFTVWIVYRSFRKWRGYLQFIDLLTHFIGGLTIAVAISVGLQTFAKTYPNELEKNGFTNEVSSYVPIYSQIRSRYLNNCKSDPSTADCQVMKYFIDHAYADVGGEMMAVRYSQQVPPGASSETAALLNEYRRRWDLTPAPIFAIIEAFRHINYLIVLPLLLGWMLGVHRRWMVWRTSLTDADQAPHVAIHVARSSGANVELSRNQED